ncbi:unnamed protein product [Tuber melanosporum]|uniref:(Perigord truffle) hypothetical protein n=1 Tax=Tuber melanosporum (strain Mel28) TaxID=656061 RepID=D5G5H9_TUBMM|nr:uncharacterized protein GSTUM_00004343001 [Tuber melanosporum]CAZ79772.1 unnamed protein product [Tuber melanosporum]
MSSTRPNSLEMLTSCHPRSSATTAATLLLFVDLLGGRLLFLCGGIAREPNFAIAGLIKTGGHRIEEVGGNANIKLRVLGSYATGVVACSYHMIPYTNIYGLLWT